MCRSPVCSDAVQNLSNCQLNRRKTQAEDMACGIRVGGGFGVVLFHHGMPGKDSEKTPGGMGGFLTTNDTNDTNTEGRDVGCWWRGTELVLGGPGVGS